MSHENDLESIEVRENQETQSLVDFVPSFKKIKGKELLKIRRPTLGESLSSEAGVQSTGFGPNSSRPVLRGLDGDRIRILQNGLGSLDASTQSLDHAVPVDMLTVDQVDIVRGPMSLIYGPSAVGGVVNLVTNRIHSVYEEGFFSSLLSQGETNQAGVSQSLHLNYGKDKWMYHIDGSTRNLADQKIPGYARSAKLRQEDPQADEAKDRLKNSFNQQDSMAVGVSRIFDRGHAGFSFHHFATNYGSVADDEVSINMTQNRGEFHLEYRPEEGFNRKIKIKSAQTGYSHKELEGGATGTVFKNAGNETRAEFMHKKDKLEGVIGLQTQLSTFSAKGEEAFLPAAKTNKLGIFQFEQLDLGKSALRFGSRVEFSDVSANSHSAKTLGLNGSIGYCYDLSLGETIEGSLSYSERAANFQELFADGAHLATGLYELGSQNLKKERSYALELNYKKKLSEHEFKTSLYAQKFQDFIFLSPTSQTDVDSGFVINRYRQTNALFYGVDGELKNTLGKLGNQRLTQVLKADYVHARDQKTGKHLPRISPARISSGFELGNDRFSFDLDLQYSFYQSKTAVAEKRTKDYLLTHVGANYYLMGDASAGHLFFRVRNLFNQEARNHVSSLKDIAPMPGRNIIFGLQLQI